MRTIIFDVASPKEAMTALLASAKIGKKLTRQARLTFPSAEAMARVLTPTRWSIVEALTSASPMGVRELARTVGRDIKGVHNDTSELIQAGVIDKTDEGKLSFPYERVKVQFALGKAA